MSKRPNKKSQEQIDRQLKRAVTKGKAFYEVSSHGVTVDHCPDLLTAKAVASKCSDAVRIFKVENGTKRMVFPHVLTSRELAA